MSLACTKHLVTAGAAASRNVWVRVGGCEGEPAARQQAVCDLWVRAIFSPLPGVLSFGWLLSPWEALTPGANEPWSDSSLCPGDSLRFLSTSNPKSKISIIIRRLETLLAWVLKYVKVIHGILCCSSSRGFRMLHDIAWDVLEHQSLGAGGSCQGRGKSWCPAPPTVGRRGLWAPRHGTSLLWPWGSHQKCDRQRLFLNLRVWGTKWLKGRHSLRWLFELCWVDWQHMVLNSEVNCQYRG